MDALKSADLLVEMLHHVTGGSVQARVGGSSVLTLDADAHNLEMDFDLFARLEQRVRSSISPIHPLRWWEIRGVPTTLARSGWQLTLREGPHEILRLGRGVSALTGHVHVRAGALWKLRRLG